MGLRCSSPLIYHPHATSCSIEPVAWPLIRAAKYADDLRRVLKLAQCITKCLDARLPICFRTRNQNYDIYQLLPNDVDHLLLVGAQGRMAGYCLNAARQLGCERATRIEYQDVAHGVLSTQLNALAEDSPGLKWKDGCSIAPTRTSPIRQEGAALTPLLCRGE